MGDVVGLFGGSFDPVHFGHLIVVRSVAEQVGMDRVVFLPSSRPPHKSAAALSAPEDRSRMVSLGIEGDGLFELSEFDLSRAGPSYTIDTVHHFRSALGEAVDLCWIIGADSLADLSTWRRAGELVEACRVVTAARRGYDDVDVSKLAGFSPVQIERLRRNVLRTPVIDISSTQIRRRVSSGLSIRNLVPPAVGAFIAERGLYRG